MHCVQRCSYYVMSQKLVWRCSYYVITQKHCVFKFHASVHTCILLQRKLFRTFTFRPINLRTYRRSHSHLPHNNSGRCVFYTLKHTYACVTYSEKTSAHIKRCAMQSLFYFILDIREYTNKLNSCMYSAYQLNGIINVQERGCTTNLTFCNS